jgi:hypothetical protein
MNSASRPSCCEPFPTKGYTDPDADPGASHSDRSFRQGPDGRRPDRHRQDRRFTLPLLQRILPFASPSPSPARHPVRVLMLAPTRELAIQVYESVKSYSKYVPIRSLCAYGGVDIKPQIEEIRLGVEVLVATPGRLLDLVEQKCLNFGRCRRSCSTKPTACSTWASSPMSRASSTCCRCSGRACSSRPPSRKKSRSSPTRCCSRRC